MTVRKYILSATLLTGGASNAVGIGHNHNDVVQKILRSARKGTKIIYVPGNHDEGFRRHCGTHFGGIEVRLADFYNVPLPVYTEIKRSLFSARKHAEKYSWNPCTDQFWPNLVRAS